MMPPRAFAFVRAASDEDSTPLLVSWLIALAAGAAWLTLVHLTVLPLAPNVVPRETPPIVSLDPDFGRVAMPATPSTVPEGKGVTAVRQRDRAGVSALADIFGATITAKVMTEIARAIPGMQTIRADAGPRTIRGDKSALSTGEERARPGLAQLGGGGSGRADVGTVRHTAAIDRAAFRAQPLPVVTAPALDGSLADATELGSFVRGRIAQLQSCYELAGGTDLAGVVALQITLGASGTVRSAEIVRRTWSGPGAADAEGCLLRIVRGWRLPSGGDGASITLPISFTRAG